MFATEAKEVILYGYDDQGVYTEEFIYLWIVGTGLASNSTLIKPPSSADGKVIVFNGVDWACKDDFRGKTAYSIETKEPKKIDYVGDIESSYTLLKPNQFDTWSGSTWVDNRTAEEIAEYERSIMLQLTPMDFEMKLVDFGLYDAVQELISTDVKLKIAYNRALYFSRTDPFIEQARIALNLAHEQIDEMWTS